MSPSRYYLCSTCRRRTARPGRCRDCERARYRTNPMRRIRSTGAWQRVRAAVKARDGGRCVRCGSTRALQVHHIVELSKGGSPFSPANLETLCQECHAGQHGATPRRHTGSPAPTELTVWIM